MRHKRWRWGVRLSAAGLLGVCGWLAAACQPGMSGYVDNSIAMAQLAHEPINSRPWNDYGPGIRISTDHYQIYTTVRDPLYQRLLGKVLEASYERSQAIRPMKPLDRPLDCFVFGDRTQWETYTKGNAGPNGPIYLQIPSGGYCQGGVFVAYDIGGSNGRELTLGVVAHESWHQYSTYAFKDHLPSWLDEGLATQNEAMEWNGTTPRAKPEMNRRRYNDLKQAMHDRSMFKLSVLASKHAGQIIAGNKMNNDRVVATYYAQLWSFVIFLEHSKYRDGLAKILDEARDGHLHDCLAGTKLSEFDIAGFTERWNSLAGPIYLMTYINPDLEKLDAEYQAFLKDFAADWAPRIPQ